MEDASEEFHLFGDVKNWGNVYAMSENEIYIPYSKYGEGIEAPMAIYKFKRK